MATWEFVYRRLAITDNIQNVNICIHIYVNIYSSWHNLIAKAIIVFANCSIVFAVWKTRHCKRIGVVFFYLFVNKNNVKEHILNYHNNLFDLIERYNNNINFVHNCTRRLKLHLWFVSDCVCTSLSTYMWWKILRYVNWYQ